MFSLALVKWAAAGLAGLSGLAFLGLDTNRDAGLPPGFAPIAVDGVALAVGVREVTRREWQACAEAGACPGLPALAAPGEPDKPMTGVNHFDVQAYLGWASARDGIRYRLPTAVEWTAFAAALPRKPYAELFSDPRLAWAANYGSMEKVSGIVQPSGSFGAMPNGLSDLGGNVWEWTSSCIRDDIEPSRCPAFKAEGLHEAVVSVFVRDPASGGCAVGAPPANIGFRLVAGN